MFSRAQIIPVAGAAIILFGLVFATSLSASAQAPPAPTAANLRPVLPPEARVDINRATPDELLKVLGMTPTWASRIVRFRPYRTKQDLIDRGVLPSDVYDRIKDYVIAHRTAQ